MLSRIFTIPIHLHGTLNANATGRFRLPIQATLFKVSASSSNDSDATLTVGTLGNPAAFCSAQPIGDEANPNHLDQDGDDIIDPERTNLDADTVITWALDYNGANGTAARNVTLLFTFLF